MTLYHTRIGEVADLASALPNIRIVLNHVGGVLGLGAYRGKQDDVFLRWSSSIKALAARPNVYVKLGGVGQGYTALRFDGIPNRHRQKRWPRDFVLTSKPASRASGRRAACLKVIFRSTRSPTAITSFGMPAS